MGKFKEFLRENDLTEDLFEDISEILDEMSEEELDQFGHFLYYEFFNEDEFEDETDEDQEAIIFTRKDIDKMIDELGSTFYHDILFFLSDENEDDSDSEEESEEDNMYEGVSRRMSAKNLNKKKRKFMKLSVAALRKTKVQRKHAAIASRADRKRYYKANKTKIAAYQKSRNTAIEKGKHFVKLRKKSGSAE